ncbi:hypothetical protein C4B63_4g83 [Trypanosoma cruzi]|uniref:Leucine-rich repeat protein (LRRP) n=1 Tax=Trypanosoma cruzi TaxID=5693 RepID=A0A2V2W163_TRYCR|nr:hypothetical protein C4B63_4g83 [Trypanosoma cruzi]
MGFNESPYQMDPAVIKATGYPVDATIFSRSSCFLELLKALLGSGVTTLLLGYNDLAQCWFAEEIEWLTRLCCRLRVLYLNGNGLLSEHLTQWANAIQTDMKFTLRELKLSRNDLQGESGGAALGRILSRCQENLENLVLDETQLGSSGTVSAFASFESSALRSLSLQRVGITTAHVLPCAVLTPLRRLIISDNHLV